MVTTQSVQIGALKPNARNARTHSKKQVRQIADSIAAFGFVVPILVDQHCSIVAGHGRYAAAKLLGLEQVLVIRLEGLSEPKRRALALADNKIAENAGWDREILAAELPELAELLLAVDLDISITGFAPAEIDQIPSDFEADSADPADSIESGWLDRALVSQSDDLWQLGHHRLLCGDARDPERLKRLMADGRAAMAFLDPPYNVRVRDIVGRGRIQHEEFAMASGEMSRADFVEFLEKAFKAAASVSREGAVHYVCMDWRHVGELVQAGTTAYDALLNMVVWVKSNAGQGSFYRSQHEFIGVFRAGNAQHLNNVELGRHGRSRSNVWSYPGVNTFRVGRMEDLKSHPTVKPVALVADAMKDCTRRGDIVLDTFCGSGTTILAAERVGRRAFGVEIEPRFVDIAIRRWQAFTRKDAINLATGKCFEEMAAGRTGPAQPIESAVASELLT